MANLLNPVSNAKPLHPFINPEIIFSYLAKFAPAKSRTVAEFTQLTTSARVGMSAQQYVTGGSGIVKLFFDTVHSEMGSFYDNLNYAWTPPEGSVSIVLFMGTLQVVDLYIAKNGVINRLQPPFFYSDFATGNDTFDVRVGSLGVNDDGSTIDMYIPQLSFCAYAYGIA